MRSASRSSGVTSRTICTITMADVRGGMRRMCISETMLARKGCSTKDIGLPNHNIWRRVPPPRSGRGPQLMRECLTIRNLCKLLISLMFALCDIRLHVRYWGRAGCA